MELEVLSVQGARPDQVVSIRAGSQRKQAAISSLAQGTPFRLAGSNGFNPFRIDILQQVGSTRLALKPGEGTYSIDLQGAGSEGGPVKVAFAVRMKGNDGSLPPKRQALTDQRDDMKEEDRRFASQAAQAKEYLESHELLPFVRALLQTVIRDRPSDPYNFIADQFRLAASAVLKPCEPQAESNDAAAFSEPLLKNVIPGHAPAAPSERLRASTKAEHNLPIFAQRAPPIEESMEQPAEPAEPAEPVDVESLRLQVRDALGQAVEDGRLQKFMEEAAPQPFAAKAEPLVVQRKSPPPAPKARIVPEAWAGPQSVAAMEAQMDLGEARLARMPVSIEENAVEEAQGPLDAMSVGSHEDDLKLAKAHATGLPESFGFKALNVEEARQKKEETTTTDSGAPQQREEAQVTDLPVSPTTEEEAPQQREETTVGLAEVTRDLPVSPTEEEAPQQIEETTVGVAEVTRDLPVSPTTEEEAPQQREETTVGLAEVTRDLPVSPTTEEAQVTDLPVSPTTEEEAPQQREETTVGLAEVTRDLPVSPTTEEEAPQQREETTVGLAEVPDLPVSPTTEEEAPQQREETTVGVAEVTRDLPVSPTTEEEAPQQIEETTVGLAEVTRDLPVSPTTEEAEVTRDLPVSPTTEEEGQPQEDTRAIDSGAHDFPASPTTEEVLLPERLERLRQKAQEALLQGAQSGELWSLLQRHAAQKAQSELLEASRSGRLQGALRQLQPEVEQIRQHAVESLVTAARSGRLLQTLQCTMKCSGLQCTRRDTREMVAAAADSGRLEEALRDARLQPEGGDLDTLRLLTREAMLMAAQSGELAHVLESVTGPGQAAQPAPGKSPSHPILRKQDTSESSIVDLSEVGTEASERPSVHTMVAERIVQELKLAADKEAVRQRNLDIKQKIAELQQQYERLLREHDELQEKMKKKSEEPGPP